MAEQLTADSLLCEAREWLSHLRETGVDGYSILAQLIERLERAEATETELRRDLARYENGRVVLGTELANARQLLGVYREQRDHAEERAKGAVIP